MIEIKIGKDPTRPGTRCEIHMEGNLLTLLTETVLMVRHVHKAITEDDPTAGEKFRAGVAAVLGDPDSGVWDLPAQDNGAVTS